MMTACRLLSRTGSHTGLALIAVLWVVAALSLVTAGVVAHARGQARTALTYQQAAVANATGDAAIAVVLSDILAKRFEYMRLKTVPVSIDGVSVSVQVVPASGLINLNLASAHLLQDMFRYGGGVSEEQAAVFADRVIDWRDADNLPLPKGAEDDAYAAAASFYTTRGRRFSVVEDLLQVLGVDYDLYVRVKDLLTVDAGMARVFPAAAPENVLAVVAAGDQGIARQYAAKREANAEGGDGTMFVAEDVQLGASNVASVFRLDAYVPFPDGSLRVRRAFVSISKPEPSRYWRTLRVWDSWVINRPVLG